MVRIGPIFIAIFAWLVLLPAAAQAACTQWDVTGGGGWHAVAGGVGVLFTLRQNQTVLRGTAEYSKDHPVRAGVGTVNGTTQGNSFDVTVVWNDGVVVGYAGKVGSDGRLQGVAFDPSNPADKEGWSGDVAFACLTAAADASPLLPICESARLARARNSPAAPGLKAQCDAAMNQQVKALPDNGSPFKSREWAKQR